MMANAAGLCKLIVLYFVCFSLASVYTADTQASKVLRVSEKTLRKMATFAVTPDYPKEAKKRKVQGVVVSQIEVDEKGDVNKVNVLEAPNPIIKKAVTEALAKWKFKTNTINGEPIRVVGKLTFYYVLANGKATVEDPFTN
jgi:TonB family protein